MSLPERFGARKCQALLAALAILSPACSDRPAPAGQSAPSASAPATSPPAPAAAQPFACAATELLACQFPPLADASAGACDYLRRYAVGRTIAGESIKSIEQCASPIRSEASALGEAMAVPAYIEIDGPPSQITFLLVRFPDGWRLVDQLLDPAWTHGGTCDVAVRLRWQRGDAGATALDTASERVCHMPLDQQEVSAGESDVASEECQRIRYTVSGARLTALSRQSDDGRCKNN
jgi:hypothetical protein